MLPIFKVGLGGPIGDGKQWMSWIHRTDLCALIIQALVDKSIREYLMLLHQIQY